MTDFLQNFPEKARQNQGGGKKGEVLLHLHLFHFNEANFSGSPSRSFIKAIRASDSFWRRAS